MIFLDSSVVVAYKIENDEHHEKSIQIMEEIAKGKYEKPLISDYIFDEVLTVIFAKSKKLSIAVETGEELKNSIGIIKISDLIFEESWQIFKNQKNTKFSFTDCTTLALMIENKIKNIATFDRDFTKVKGINVVG